MDKCEVICRNCHIEEHTDVNFFFKFKKEIYEKVKNYKNISKKVDRNKVLLLHKQGLINKDIATIIGCASSTISDILRGRLKSDKKINFKG